MCAGRQVPARRKGVLQAAPPRDGTGTGGGASRGFQRAGRNQPAPIRGREAEAGRGRASQGVARYGHGTAWRNLPWPEGSGPPLRGGGSPDRGGAWRGGRAMRWLWLVAVVMLAGC